jgi:hypothetical protein
VIRVGYLYFRDRGDHGAHLDVLCALGVPYVRELRELLQSLQRHLLRWSLLALHLHRLHDGVCDDDVLCHRRSLHHFLHLLNLHLSQMKRLDQVFCDLGHRGGDDDCANCVIQHRSLIRQVLLLLLLGQQPSLQRSCAQVLPLHRLLERLEQESLQTFALKE